MSNPKRCREILQKCVGIMTAIETDTFSDDARTELWSTIMQCLAEIHWLGKEIKETTNKGKETLFI